MNQEARPRAAVELDTQRRQVVAELMSTIKLHYPSAAFSVRNGIDDPEATYITAIVDIDDPDEVLDLVEDRLLALQLGAEAEQCVVQLTVTPIPCFLLAGDAEAGQDSLPLAV